MSVVFAILLFGFLIVTHELGHFVAAKLSGVQVNEFAVFMGPAIAKWKRGETQYSIRCIPIGGYCAMEGEDGGSDNPRAFHKAAWWKKLIILVAGSFMNFLAGVIIVAIVLFSQPRYVVPQIAEIDSRSTLACENGLQEGDTILKLDGKRIGVYEDFQLATMMLPDGEYDMVVLRNGEKVKLENVPMIRSVPDVTNPDELMYGLEFTIKETTAASVPGRILPTAMNHVKMVVVSLKMLLTGQAGFRDMSGPVGIVKMMSDSTSQAGTLQLALVNLLWFGGFIAINLAVMNMLPIPALDGGRVLGLLLTMMIEKIARKKLDPKYEGYVHGIGMILLLILMAVILFKDVFVLIMR